jgi:hypothetical protein
MSSYPWAFLAEIWTELSQAGLHGSESSDRQTLNAVFGPALKTRANQQHMQSEDGSENQRMWVVLADAVAVDGGCLGTISLQATQKR